MPSQSGCTELPLPRTCRGSAFQLNTVLQPIPNDSYSVEIPNGVHCPAQGGDCNFPIKDRQIAGTALLSTVENCD